MQPVQRRGRLGVPARGDGVDGLGEADVVLAVVGAHDPQPGEAVPAVVHRQVVGEGVHAQQAGVRPAGNQRGPLGGPPDGGRRQLEVLRPVVVQDEQPLGAVRARLVGHLVLDALAARRDDGQLPLRGGRVQQPHLAGHLAGGRHGQEALAAGQPGADPEPLIGFLEDHDVAGGRCPDHVPPHPPRPPRVVNRDVEQRRPVQRPRASVERPRDLVGQRLPGLQVLDPQREALAAGEVGRERQPPRVRADAERPEREEARIPGQGVGVQQDFLAGQRLALAWPLTAGKGRRVVARAGRATALQPVLLALHRPAVIPPGPLAGRHRQVGLLRPPLDLAEDRLAQALFTSGQRLGISVFRLQERDRARRILDGQPGVGVGDAVPVEGADGRHLPGGRGRQRLARGRLGTHGLSLLSAPRPPGATAHGVLHTKWRHRVYPGVRSAQTGHRAGRQRGRYEHRSGSPSRTVISRMGRARAAANPSAIRD